uniref:Uncharacterized protein n=1 Tax=Scophthalmus maximus TaxID=52904 RepID=A0A8D3E2F8_SCOMX
MAEENELEKRAIEELLRETDRARVRAETMGPADQYLFYHRDQSTEDICNFKTRSLSYTVIIIIITTHTDMEITAIPRGTLKSLREMSSSSSLFILCCRSFQWLCELHQSSP